MSAKIKVRPASRRPIPVSVPAHKINSLVPAFLTWFSQNARDLPWRRTRDPYAIWVSEIMLQQTQVKTVIPYWKRWMKALPTIEALARATPEKIHKLWEGLGYYTRVRNIHKAAQEIMIRHHGQFPETYDEILALPGIGRYTAGAICSIAFNQPTPILDGNVIRVLTRIFAIGENPRDKSTNNHLWQLAEQLVSHATNLKSARKKRGSSNNDRNAEALPPSRLFHPPPEGEGWGEGEGSGKPTNASLLTVTQSTINSPVHQPTTCSHLNQSLMELGALICTPKQPTCPACPVRPHCAAHRRGIVDQLPNLGPQAPATARRFVAFVCESRGSFLVRQRPAGVVNAHLWEFPNIEIAPDANGFALKRAATKILGNTPASLAKLCTVKHSITRYRITLDVFKVGSSRCDDRTGASPFPHARTPKVHPRKTSLHHSTTPSPLLHAWLPLKKLNRLAFPGAHRKIVEHLVSLTLHYLPNSITTG